MTWAVLMLNVLLVLWLGTGAWRCRKCHARGSFLWAVFHGHGGKREGLPLPHRHAC